MVAQRVKRYIFYRVCQPKCLLQAPLQALFKQVCTPRRILACMNLQNLARDPNRQANSRVF